MRALGLGKSESIDAGPGGHGHFGFHLVIVEVDRVISRRCLLFILAVKRRGAFRRHCPVAHYRHEHQALHGAGESEHRAVRVVVRHAHARAIGQIEILVHGAEVGHPMRQYRAGRGHSGVQFFPRAVRYRSALDRPAAPSRPARSRDRSAAWPETPGRRHIPATGTGPRTEYLLMQAASYLLPSFPSRTLPTVSPPVTGSAESSALYATGLRIVKRTWMDPAVCRRRAPLLERCGPQISITAKLVSKDTVGPELQRLAIGLLVAHTAGGRHYPEVA